MNKKIKKINILQGLTGETISRIDGKDRDKILFEFNDWTVIKKNLNRKKKVFTFNTSLPSLKDVISSKAQIFPKNDQELSLLKAKDLIYIFFYDAFRHYLKSMQYLIAALTSWENFLITPGSILLYYSKFFSIIALTQLQLKSNIWIQGQLYQITLRDDCCFIRKLTTSNTHKMWWQTFYKAYKKACEHEKDSSYNNLFNVPQEYQDWETISRNWINYDIEVAVDEIYHSPTGLRDLISSIHIPIFDSKKVNRESLYEIEPEVAFAADYIKFFTEKIKSIVSDKKIDYKKYLLNNFKNYLRVITTQNKSDSVKSLKNYILKNFY